VSGSIALYGDVKFMAFTFMILIEGGVKTFFLTEIIEVF
jgi:hypothetical protein